MSPASRGSSAWRAAWWGMPCDPRTLVTVPLVGCGPVTVHRLAATPFRILAWVLRKHGYHVRPEATGAYNCRKITGGATASAHAFGLALDVNWDTNPYRLDRLVTDMPRRMVDEVLALRTRAGAPVFRWGGDWDGRPDTPHSNYDAMHFEIVATPQELLDGVEWPAFNLHDPCAWPVLHQGDRGAAVRQLQATLGLAPADGIFGPATRAAAEGYQRAHGLPADGIVGLGTWTALLTAQPTATDGAPSPHKGLAA